MHKSEPYLPSNSKIFRQAMYTLWRREQYMSVHPPDLNFSGQMPYLYPTPYPIGLWNPWAFNMGMNNMDSAVFPCFESGTKFYKSSKKNDKISIPRTNKFPEQGFQGQVSPRYIPPPVHPTSFKHQSKLNSRNIPPPVRPSCYKPQDQLSPRHIPPPVYPSHFGQRQKPSLVQSSGYKQQSQPGSRQISPPVQHPYPKPYKNYFVNSNDSSRNQICRFCLQNGERREYCSTHQLKDQYGKVTCPILQKYVCGICKATGAYAHTKAYCPFIKEKNKKPLAVILKQTSHDSCGRIRSSIPTN